MRHALRSVDDMSGRAPDEAGSSLDETARARPFAPSTRPCDEACIPSDKNAAESGAHDAIVAATRHWLTRAVIGLNLCPFAKSVYVKRQIRYAVSDATGFDTALADLECELRQLRAADPDEIDTTLLIFPRAFVDFSDYNDVLYFAERLLAQLRLRGTVQIASFHPYYQFDGTEANDIENYTNRAPYPILHLLREASIARAVDAFPDASTIYSRNQQTLRDLGHDGWQAWMANAGPPDDECDGEKGEPA